MSSTTPPPPPPALDHLNISTSTYDSNLSCLHLSDLRSRDSPNLFHNFRTLISNKPNTNALKCLTCGHAQSKLYACITCPDFFCKLHAQVHASAFSDASHSIAMDMERVELYCCLCKDQIYDKEFDAAVVLSTAKSLTGKSQNLDSIKNTPKRRRVEYKPWKPNQSENDLICENSTPLKGHVADQKLENSKGHVADEKLENSSELKGNVEDENLENSKGHVGDEKLENPTEVKGHVADEIEKGVLLGQVAEIGGLRGLNNLGNTCFMNSVLQALLHTPPLRNYFLSDKHNRYLCRKNNDDVVLKEVDEDLKMKGVRFCLACELDAMFSVAFAGDRAPFTPAKFLYSWWQHALNLASYEQQDAHEFFISILDGVHEKLQMNQGKPQSQVSNECCIAHKVFSGILRSDVMCTACGFTSTTYDPCVDISLDLEPTKGTSSKTSKKSKQSVGNKDLSQKSRMATLLGCLDRFTRPERLGSDQKFFCQQCQVRQESLKQMSIRKLPLVSCFHIKRFEHSSLRKMTRKVDTYLQFPFSLDLAPYLSSSILKSRFGNRMFYFEGGESDSSNEFSSKFELFAVITHTGKLDSGHYVTYLRLSNRWYKCDDAWITQVSDNVVRASQGYMMFYVQKMLYYKASESSEPA